MKCISPLSKALLCLLPPEGKKNNNYLMGTYEDTINTGDHAPNLIAADLLCNTMQMLNRVEGLEAGNPMPPTGLFLLSWLPYTRHGSWQACPILPPMLLRSLLHCQVQVHPHHQNRRHTVTWSYTGYPHPTSRGIRDTHSVISTGHG